MMRTTIYLPDTLHQRLRIASKKQKQSVSKLATDILDDGLSEHENKSLDRMYEAMEKVKGVSKGGDADVSSTIDETLYGENGTWRGSDPE